MITVIGNLEASIGTLRGLRGLEVAGLVGKSFGLPTLNVDRTNDPHTPERQADLQRHGHTRTVDVVALPHQLPFPDRVYDYLVCGRVAELSRPEVALVEWMRVADRYILLGFEVASTGGLPAALERLIEQARLQGFEVQLLQPSLPWAIPGYTLLLVRQDQPVQQSQRPSSALPIRALRFLGRRWWKVGLLLATGWVVVQTGWYLWMLPGLWLGVLLWRDLVQRLWLPRIPTYPHPAPLEASARQETVGAVVVTYNPGPDLPDNLRTLIGQVAEVLVVDNASTTGQEFLEAIRAMPGVTLVKNAQNLGIATALNQGSDWAVARGYLWLATFDQDSRLTGGLIQHLLEAVQAYRWPDRVGIVVPRVVYPWYSYPISSSCLPREWVAVSAEVRRIAGGITSGSLVHGSLLTRERWPDHYFIDHVDYEFCLRAAHIGFHTVEAGRVFLFHQTGTVVGEGGTPPMYPPDRLYYIVRNLIDMARRHFWAFPLVMGSYVHTVLQGLWQRQHVLFGDQKRSLAVRQGWQDAWRGIRGPRPR